MWKFYTPNFEYEKVFQDLGFPWAGHKFFGYDLVRNLEPKKIVELGTYKGTSLFSFCQAVKDGQIDTEIYAVDTWEGDIHAGFYDESVFKEVKRIINSFYPDLRIILVRKTFDDAVSDFEDNSIDVLHIDGLHTYEAVKNDFDNWLIKVNKDGIILFHDIAVKQDDFGVYKFWDEIKERYKTLEFIHSYGLGVLFKNPEQAELFNFQEIWQNYYSALGEKKILEATVRDKDAHMGNLEATVRDKDATLNNIYNSHGWRFLLKYYKIRDRLLQEWKRGRTIAKLFRRLPDLITKENIKKSIRHIRSSGFRAFYWKAREKFRTEISYDVWIKKNEPKQDELERQRGTRFAYEPKISVIVPTYNTPVGFLIAMIESLLNQTYPRWELCIADGASKGPQLKKVLKSYAEKDERIKVNFLHENRGIAGNSNEALSFAAGEFIALLDHDDMLPPFALFDVVKKINEHPDVEFIYSDRDKISNYRRFDPFFKPDWSPDYLLSQNYLCHLNIIKKALIDKIGWFREGFDGSQDYDLVLRITEHTDKIIHIPKILYHWRVSESSAAGNPEAKPYAYPAAIRALQDAVNRRGWRGTVTQGKVKGLYRVIFELNGNPRVSIIIPTKDKSEVLKKCVDSILNKTTYKNYEVAIVDNQSTEEKTLEYYNELMKNHKIKLLSYDKPFNFSEINNYAVSKLNAEYVLFLNNDTEVITENWIELMLGFAQRRETGAVGAKLIYPDGTIQTAGLILDEKGNVKRSHYRYASNSLGYAGRILSIQNVSSVAAACMMVRREVFDEVEGFDPQFVVAHGDIDFCLKLRERNYLIVYEPHVELYHYESLTRGYEDTPEKVERLNRETRLLLKKRGYILEKGDPYFNPNLTADKEDFSIRI